MLRFTLETNGYRVLVASNGEAAIAVFVKAPQIDLVVSCAVMAGMSGDQLAEKLKRMRPFLPVLLLGDTPTPGAATVTPFGAVTASKNCTSFELLECVKVMAARKRGPRKGATGRNAVPEMAVQRA